MAAAAAAAAQMQAGWTGVGKGFVCNGHHARTHTHAHTAISWGLRNVL